MAGREAVKPDPSLWLPLLDEYRVTALPHDTVLRGTLRSGLDAASPEVVDALARWPAAAYLQTEGEATGLVLVYRLRDEPRRWPLAHVLLFLATVITTLGSGALMAGLDPFSTRVFYVGDVGMPYPSRLDLSVLWLGAPFAIPFLGVLLAHEMGHYFAARVHRVRASLPYFIPFPPYFSVIGTVGAFIRLKGPTVRRSILFDIGAAGPISSFLVSLPLFVVGLGLSEAIPDRAGVATPFLIRFMGQPVWLGDGVATHVLASLFGPGQVGDSAILLHPLALVGWLGFFVTALNLLPLGQLDGGHILYALAPQRHSWAARGFLVALFPLGLLWWGWWGWAAIVLVLHRGRVGHPRVVQQESDIGRARRAVGWALIAIFFLTLVPVPLKL
jgi:membrane-associated protease RseP (regulator of RpoE activity)